MAYALGLVSISFRKHTPEEILKAMQANGLSFVEWGSDVHAPCGDMETLQKLAALQKQYGIVCCSYGTYFRLGVTPLTQLPDYIRSAKALGTNILRLWCGDQNSEDYTPEEKAALFAACREAAALAEAEQVTLCMECHNRTYTNRAESALELMTAVASPHFRMYWQPNQYRTEAENLEYARKLAAYTDHIHVFNWKEKERFPLADARTLWRQYLACFTGDRKLLLEFMPDDRLQTLPAETAALKSIIDKLVFKGEYVCIKHMTAW